jgi:hypothetical protein
MQSKGIYKYPIIVISGREGEQSDEKENWQLQAFRGNN